jgi:hypothetical protein
MVMSMVMVSIVWKGIIRLSGNPSFIWLQLFNFHDVVALHFGLLGLLLVLLHPYAFGGQDEWNHANNDTSTEVILHGGYWHRRSIWLINIERWWRPPNWLHD